MAETDCSSSVGSWNTRLHPDILIDRKTENDKQPINRLPSELLSRIFAIGDEDQRYKRIRNYVYRGFQDLAVVSMCHV